jgi:hypothetical protein
MKRSSLFFSALALALATIFASSTPSSAQITVDIDIKPGSDPNSINLGSKGKVAVAVLGSASFDVSTIDPATVVFAGAAPSPVRGKTEDVNLDGYLDMVFHFRTQDLGLTGSSTDATLTGTYGGGAFTGTDAVNIVQED